MSLATRLARCDDIPVLAVMERELARLAFPDAPIEDLEYHRRKLRRALNREPEGMVVVAQSEDPATIRAWLWMSAKTTLATGERYGVVRSIFVRPEFRRQGLGRALAQYALTYFAQLGVRRLVVKIDHANVAAAGLFASAGFVPRHLTLERSA